MRGILRFIENTLCFKKGLKEGLYSAYKNYVILAYHWSIKTYIGLQLDIWSVYWPIIGHLYSMTSFFIGTIKSSTKGH